MRYLLCLAKALLMFGTMIVSGAVSFSLAAFDVGAVPASQLVDLFSLTTFFPAPGIADRSL